MDNRCGRIDYDPVIEDDICKLGSERTKPAGCAICWAGCLAREHFRGVYPDAWWWMHHVSLLTDESYLCVDGFKWRGEEPQMLCPVPRPIRTGHKHATYSSETLPNTRLLADRSIRKVSAIPWFEDCFLFTADGRTEPAQVTDRAIWPGEEMEEPTVETYALYGQNQPHFYLPAHDACLCVLEHFLGARKTLYGPCSGMQTLAEFYYAILRAFQLWRAENDYPDPPVGVSRDPRCSQNTFEESRLKARMGGWRRSCWFSFEALFRWEPDREAIFFANPSDVGDYTQALLRDAPRVSVRKPGADNSQLSRLLRELPQELFDRILDELHPIEDMSIICGRQLPFEFWRGVLTTPGMLPWLWDLDLEQVRHATQDDIDWEMFVRMLAQPDLLQNFPSIPRGLRNRHSIWRNLACLSRSAAGIDRSSEDEASAGSELRADQLDHGGDTNFGPNNARSVETGDDNGFYTALDVEWIRRTEEEIRLHTSDDDEFRTGHWSVKWRRLPIDEDLTQHL